MSPLTDSEKQELLALIEAEQPLPEKWQQRFFPATPRAVDVGEEYRVCAGLASSPTP